MFRVRLDRTAFLVASVMLVTGAFAADDLKKPTAATATPDAIKKVVVAPTGFYRKFFEPRMTSRLNGEFSAAAEFADPAANPWTKDGQTVSRIERNAIRATKKALKQYAVESLHIDSWSVPLFKTGGSGLGSVGDESSRARLRFGISHLRPRAEVQIPSARGQATFSIDGLGGMGASFQSKTSNFSLGVSYNVPTHAGWFSISRTF